MQYTQYCVYVSHCLYLPVRYYTLTCTSDLHWMFTMGDTSFRTGHTVLTFFAKVDGTEIALVSASFFACSFLK